MHGLGNNKRGFLYIGSSRDTTVMEPSMSQQPLGEVSHLMPPIPAFPIVNDTCGSLSGAWDASGWRRPSIA